MPEPKPKCSKSVSDSSGFFYHPCQRDMVAVEDGKPYCRQHLPSEVAKREAARKAQWEEEWKKRDERYAAEKVRARRVEAALNALAGIPTAALEAGVVAELVTAATAIDRLLQEASWPGYIHVEIAERDALKIALMKLTKEA